MNRDARSDGGSQSLIDEGKQPRQNTMRWSLFSILVMLCVPSLVWATNPIDAGRLSFLSFRGDYVMFKVLESDGINACESCPGDPAGMSGGAYCWIAKADQAKLALLLTARGTGSMISGRVTDLASNCTVYQLTLHD